MAYARKLGDLPEALDRLTDARPAPRIPTSRIARSLFAMFALRLGSLNALELSRDRRAFWRRWAGGEVPSADTLGRVPGKMRPHEIREILADVYSSLMAQKALPPLRAGLRALAIDGHELPGSYLRCCVNCHQRQVTTRHGTQTQYFHKYVAGILLCGRDMTWVLDLESMRPGEGEVEAAGRLLERLVGRLPRAFDVVLADALYTATPWLRLVRSLGKHFLVVAKENAHVGAHAQLDEVVATEAPRRIHREGRQIDVWDASGIRLATGFEEPVRMLHSHERWSVRRQRSGALEPCVSTWRWMTSLPTALCPSEPATYLGHMRWGVENQGFNEAVNEWQMDHAYRHDLVAFEVLWLLGYLAMNLVRAFHRRRIRPRRPGVTVRHLVRELAAALYAVAGQGLTTPG